MIDRNNLFSDHWYFDNSFFCYLLLNNDIFFVNDWDRHLNRVHQYFVNKFNLFLSDIRWDNLLNDDISWNLHMIDDNSLLNEVLCFNSVESLRIGDHNCVCWYFLWHFFFNIDYFLVNNIDRDFHSHRPIDVDLFGRLHNRHLDLFFHNFFNILRNCDNFLHNSWNDDYFLYNSLNFHSFRHLNKLFNNFFPKGRHFLYNFSDNLIELLMLFLKHYRDFLFNDVRNTLQNLNNLFFDKRNELLHCNWDMNFTSLSVYYWDVMILFLNLH